MDWPRRLFFYGTLTHEHDNALTRLILPRLGTRARRGWVRGTLRLIPDPDGVYPVLVPGAGRVWGWAYGECRPVPRAMLAALDDWEQYDPQRPRRGEYRRAAVIVHTRGGPVRAQAYLPNRRAHPGLAPVPGGDFAAHAAARKLGVLTG